MSPGRGWCEEGGAHCCKRGLGGGGEMHALSA